jgi:hypothetical protein
MSNCARSLCCRSPGSALFCVAGDLRLRWLDHVALPPRRSIIAAKKHHFDALPSTAGKIDKTKAGILAKTNPF